jgi:hypothetical protein
LRAKIRERLQGANKVGTPMILETGVKPHFFEGKRELHYKDSGDCLRDKILAVHRTPKTCVGIVDTVSRDNAFTSWLIFHHDAILPILQFFSETLTKDFRKRYNNIREVVYYPDNYPVDPELKRREWEAHVKSGCVWANEYRKAWGMEPLDEDFLLIPTKKTDKENTSELQEDTTKAVEREKLITKIRGMNDDHLDKLRFALNGSL